ncbi:MAG: aspartate aminotransferase family protein [Deltaproteobacteria bacterium]|nr:aspartate aminotransferase family protein [Deltaproteobacteria bacterium]
MSSRSKELYQRARRVLPGGVSRNTLLRSPHPLYAKSAEGCRVVDVDGVERIDFANNMASLIHGHADPRIVAAVSAQLVRGTAFTLGTEVEIAHAEHLCSRNAGFDKVRFMNSGTEAVMAAFKAARALTGRQRFAKVEGTYHGAYDYAEVSQAPGPENWGPPLQPASVPLAEGTPENILRDVIVLPFNQPEAAIARLEQYSDELAGVLLDPMPHRAGFSPASDAFVSALARWTQANGALLIFDEVITFRTEFGGMQTRYAERPDLTAMGKIIGGGFPVGALAGRDELMAVFDASSGAPRLPHSGTFSANPVTMAAGLSAMQRFDEAAVARLNALGERARQQIRQAIDVAGVPASVTGTGSLFRIHLKAEAPDDYRSSFLTAEEKRRLDQFIDQMYQHGVMLIHTGAGTLCTPMGQDELDRLADAVCKSLRQLRTAHGKR